MTVPTRKPRIALMGEFSAGKSTLSNFLIGARLLPEQVTATRLPPVWISEGQSDPYRISTDGSETPVDLEHLDQIPLDETRVIRVFHEADILQSCDLIDFPGISDPSMSEEVWHRMLDQVDAVIWCTHATQAWRQSEAAVWKLIPQAVRDKSILLVTRFDMIATKRDQDRVLARIANETRGLFSQVLPISLLAAIAAGEDHDAMAASGGLAFLDALADIAGDPTLVRNTMPEPMESATGQTDGPVNQPATAPSQIDTAPAAKDSDDKATTADPATAGRVVPRRVRPASGRPKGVRPTSSGSRRSNLSSLASN